MRKKKKKKETWVSFALPGVGIRGYAPETRKEHNGPWEEGGGLQDRRAPDYRKRGRRGEGQRKENHREGGGTEQGGHYGGMPGNGQTNRRPRGWVSRESKLYCRKQGGGGGGGGEGGGARAFYIGTSIGGIKSGKQKKGKNSGEEKRKRCS